MAVLLSSRIWFGDPERSQPERTKPGRTVASDFYEISDNLAGRFGRLFPRAVEGGDVIAQSTRLFDL
jgi:hypothetical protein